MKKVRFLIIPMAILIVLAGVAKPAPVVAEAPSEYKIFLPMVAKPFLAPECLINVKEGQTPNSITFGINCQNVPDGWAHMEFDILGYDNASTDVLLTDGVGFTNHDYPWPQSDFNARLTVLGQDSAEYQFDISITINWP